MNRPRNMYGGQELNTDVARFLSDCRFLRDEETPLNATKISEAVKTNPRLGIIIAGLPSSTDV